MGGEPILLKFLIVAVLGWVVPAAVMMTCCIDRRWVRLWLIVLLALSIRFPVMTIDFHHGFRHNVRGWEICWSDYIAIGLVGARLLTGQIPRIGVIGVALFLHLGLLGVSSVQGMDLEFSGFYLARQVRGAVVFCAVAACLRSQKDLRSLLIGIAIICIWNEAAVLRQKYLEGRFQCIGAFDHQNAMAMAMILCGPVLLGALVMRGVRGGEAVIVSVGLMASAHSVLASLSRAGMLVYGVACGLVLVGSLVRGLETRKVIWLGGFVSAGLLGVLVMLPTLMERFSDKTANKASHRTREVMNDAAAAMYTTHPWFGVGPNNYAFAVNQMPYADMVDESIREKGHKVDPEYRRGIVESHYWQMRAEGGWFGFTSFMIVLAFTLVAAVVRSLIARDPVVIAIAMGCSAGLLGNYVQSQFEHTLVNYTNMYCWMVLCGALAAMPWRGQSVWREGVGKSSADEDSSSQMQAPDYDLLQVATVEGNDVSAVVAHRPPKARFWV